jgi:hypothetical protein
VEKDEQLQQPVDAGAPDANTPVEEQFDQERAMKTIRALRASEKALEKKLADQARAAELAKLSETDQLKKQLDETKAERAAMEAAARESELRYKVYREAARLNFNDPDDAYAMLRLSELQGDEDIPVQLSGILSKKPYLAKTAGASAPPANAVAPQSKVSPGNPAGGVSFTVDQLLRMSPEDYARLPPEQRALAISAAAKR